MDQLKRATPLPSAGHERSCLLQHRCFFTHAFTHLQGQAAWACPAHRHSLARRKCRPPRGRRGAASSAKRAGIHAHCTPDPRAQLQGQFRRSWSSCRWSRLQPPTQNQPRAAAVHVPEQRSSPPKPCTHAPPAADGSNSSRRPRPPPPPARQPLPRRAPRPHDDPAHVLAPAPAQPGRGRGAADHGAGHPGHLRL